MSEAPADTKMLLPIDRLLAYLAPLVRKAIVETPLDTATREGMAGMAANVLYGHHTPAEAHLCRAVELLCTHRPNDEHAFRCVEAAYELVRWERHGEARHADEMDAKPWQAKEAHR
ncbi:hypothetical protein A7A08_01678 [Methyloligella halotolerans]|uniref:Uncharacterized protein n=1 Tax=Methyloligella halotolerans TaxID=1177755 RepID=A0A1E2RZI7_9HYPH|nr:hypothetical protein [Methyloligella halotolerans]ODA67643.1 hypothetical protein A7A08_01678 [Methyloligella halotolerans]